ncbi:MAG: ATP-binding protein [Candidatus Gracilibacteria bacterium]|nr:ATP-binding protein [Candidatus Gracilibacteria bacterium]MDQ7023886.1 ATP-binding protein [Candidatus Gracilibacteria bacterium]
MINEILESKIILRKAYLDEISDYFDSPVIKVITGMRRVGKSYILQKIIQKLFKGKYIEKGNIFYINKESLKFDFIIDYKDLQKEFELFLNKANLNKKIFIGIDEIQDIKGWEKFINSVLLEYGNNSEIFITGSNSNLLSSELATLLTGRYIEFEIFPLSFSEYLLFGKKENLKSTFIDYLKYGGLPGIFNMKEDEKVIFNYLSSIYSTILLKDIVRSFGLRNIDFFESLYKYIFSNIGHIFSAKKISDYLKSQRVKISTETVLNYLGYGLKVFLLDLVKAEDPITKRYFEIYNKYYVGDLGIRNSLVGFNFGRDIGNLLENYVYLELKRKRYEIKIGRLKSGKEIDFIATKNGITKYFQVCYLLGSEDTIKREYGSLKEVSDNWEKYVVSFDDIDFGISEGIKHINIMDLEKHL